MMEVREPAITVESVSKRYPAGRRVPNVPIPSLLPTRWQRRLERTLPDDPPDDDELLAHADDEEEAEDFEREISTREVWAVRDLSFEVAPGTALGVVGPNGAGKSTLLRLLGRVTPPTSGRILLRGRVAPVFEIASSLLQPNSTARDNVFMLARFLGVPRDVAERQLPHIIDFAELGGLADVEVGNYSTGLYRRLGFAIVLNLEPDIIIADEKLAVGDYAFRERCLREIERLIADGAAVVVATHDMKLVSRLCSEALWMEDGRILDRNPPAVMARRWEERLAATKASRRGLAYEAFDSVEIDVPAPLSPAGKTALLVRFLTIARGDEAAARAFAEAEAVATERGYKSVKWYDVADAAGVAHAEAEAIIARLGGESPPPPRKQRIFNEHLAIVDAGIVTTEGERLASVSVDEEARIEVELELATAGVQITVTVVLVGNTAPGVRLAQPEPHTTARPGPHIVSVWLPAGLLREDRYSAQVGVRVVDGNVKSTVTRRDVFTFDAYALRGDSDDGVQLALELVDAAELSWEVIR